MLQELDLTIYNLDKFQDSVAKLNRKSVKANIPSIEFTIGDLTEESFLNEYGEREHYWYYPVHVVYPGSIVLPGGWQLVASLDHFEGLVKIVPGEELPTMYRERGPVCDHCGVNRERKKTYVLRSEDGRYVQLGSTCIGMYFGIDPNITLAQFVYFDDAEYAEFDGFSRGEPMAFQLDKFLAHVSLMINNHGWLSRSNAYEHFRVGDSTADRAWHNMLQKIKNYRIQPTKEDFLMGEIVAKWMATLHERSNLDDFMFNLAKIGENQFVTHKSIGFASAAINAMKREIEDAMRSAATKYVANVGDVYEGDVTMVIAYARETDWGAMFTNKFKTNDGNVICWSTSQEFKEGVRYHIRGRVKKLDEYRGEKQTHLTRCKIEEI